jgi:hypothetical protein
VVNQNVLFAIGSSLAVMTLAGLGMISPVAGAVVQNVGTFGVVVNSARLLRFDALGPELTSDPVGSHEARVAEAPVASETAGRLGGGQP